MNFFRNIRLLLPLFIFPFASGCFEVMQVIDARRDGTIHMSLRVSVPVSLQKQQEQKNWRTPTARDILPDTGRIKSYVTTQDLSDDVVSRRQFDFTTNRSLLRRVSDSDRGLFLPYPDGGNQWVFLFGSASMSGGGASDQSKQPDDMSATLLSSASYKIFFRGFGQPRRAAFTALDGRRVYLRVTPFADASVVEVPIMLLARGGVLTTGHYWNLDFRRTDRLVSYLKEGGASPVLPANGDDANPDKTNPDKTGPEKKPANGASDQTTIPSPNSDDATVPGPKK